jgi:pimeloyl-ACP methyl ester carboxylesterase
MRRLPILVACLVLCGACAAEPGVTAREAHPSGNSFDPASDPFGWTALRRSKRVEIGSITVPMDYADPSKGTFNLHVARHLAMKPSERIGSLLVNPGGPGFGGSDFAVSAEQIYDQSLLDRFDIVAWDPRGTGQSEPHIDCISDYDRFYASGDITPEDAAGRQLLQDQAKEFATDCVTKNAAFYQYVGTNNSARDMDAIRAALGEDKISYFGFSYGSELGATWATLFPTTVRAAVLDGAADPTADFVTGGLEQAQGFEAAFTSFLTRCSGDTKCAFRNNGDAAGAFGQLMTKIDTNPIAGKSGRPAVSAQVAITAVSEAMYSERSWSELETALAKAQGGDGSGLLALYDQYYQRKTDGTYDDSLEAFQVISCMDTAERPTVEQSDANVAKFEAVAPQLTVGTIGDYFCTYFPPPVDPRVDITGKGAGPILVMGTTGDPATPLDSTRKMASTLEDGRLVVVDGNQHTGYGVNSCSSAAVNDYLIDPVGHLPADGLRCV